MRAGLFYERSYNPFHRQFYAVIFDLDGTLVNSAPAFQKSINVVIDRYNENKEVKNKIRYPDLLTNRHACYNTQHVVKFAFGITEDDPEFNNLHQQFLDIYKIFSNDRSLSPLYDGIEDMLNYLDLNSIPWGIITNKPPEETGNILRELHLGHRAGCVVARQDPSGKLDKPHPLPYRLAFEQMKRSMIKDGFSSKAVAQLRPQHCLFIDDLKSGIEGGQKYRMTTIAAEWGFHKHDADLTTWGCPVFDRPSQLHYFLKAAVEPIPRENRAMVMSKL